MTKNDNIKYFQNSKEELEFYRNKYKLKEEELLSCQSKIKVLENINNKLKEKINLGFLKGPKNNEFSQFIFTPNEFKKLWESIIQTELIDCFDFCIKEYKLISNLCQDIMLLVYEETKNIIELKFVEILKCFNLAKTSKTKKDNIYLQILPFFRENFNSIFEFNQDKIKNINQKLKIIVENYNFLEEINLFKNRSSITLDNIYQNNIINENDIENKNINENLKIIENNIKEKNFDKIIKRFFTICLYMLLHEPVLSFNIDNFSKRKLNYCFYKRKEFINLEGFGNENTPCIIVLPPPLLKNKYPFNGLRPAVYMLSKSNINNEIINQCEINEKNKEEKYAEINKNNEIFRKNQNISVLDKKKVKNRIIKKNINQKFRKENNDIIQNTSPKLNKYNNNKINKKILNKSAKINNNIFENLENANKNTKILKNKIQTKYQSEKYGDNNKNVFKNENINNNFKSKQNISYGIIQNENNNYNKNNKLNYFLNNFENNKKVFNENNTERKIRKEKTLPEGFRYEKSLELLNNNPFLSSSQQISKSKNGNKAYIKKSFHNEINSLEISKNYIKNIINNNQNSNQKLKNHNLEYNDNLYYLNKNNNNIKNQILNYQITEKNNINDEKFKRNNTVALPYSEINNILIENNNNFKRQLTNINDNNKYMILKKINKNKNEQVNSNNINSKKANYYSYDDYDMNNIINEGNQFSERKMNIENNIKYNNNENKLYIKKRVVQTSIQQKKYNPFNLKDNYLIKKNNLYPLFKTINDNQNKDKMKNNTFEVGVQNQKINYINNINNFNNINNINNINYYNNIYKNDLSLNNNRENNNLNKKNINNKINPKKNLKNKIYLDKNNNSNNFQNDFMNNNFNKSNQINNLNYHYDNNMIENNNENHPKIKEIHKLGPTISPNNKNIHKKINTLNIYQTKNNNKVNNNNKNLFLQNEQRNKNIINNTSKTENKNYNKNKKYKYKESKINTINLNNNINYLNHQISSEFNKQKENSINRNKILKKRNNSLNTNYLNHNNFNNNMKRNKNSNEFVNTYKDPYYNYNNMGLKNLNNNEDNFNNESFNINNYYLNDLEVMKLNNKYKFNESYTK